MIYVMHGHSLRHAVEEMLYHLLPEEPVTPSDSENGASLCVSSLVERDGVFTATAAVTREGQMHTAERQIAAAGQSETERKRAASEAVRLSIFDAVLPLLEHAPEWGSLTGVRPAKLARGLMERGMGRGETAAYLREHYSVSPQRAALTMRAAATAQFFSEQITPQDISLYIGIPFCPSRCYYCSFVSSTVAGAGALIEPYLDTLCVEIAQVGQLVREYNLRVQSIYIGGGTPTTLEASQLARLFLSLQEAFAQSEQREFTVEAGRPDTITEEKLRVMRAAGVDRISINPQSMEDTVLQQIGRRHTQEDVRRAFALARDIGGWKINMDLIAGLSGDTVQSFSASVEKLCALRPENITVHSLAVKRGADLSDKSLVVRQHNTVSAMLDSSAALLSENGYGPYYLYRQKFAAGENVGWCLPGDECFYNVAMMEELQTILSLGAGGVSKRVDRDTGWIERVNNPKYPLEYINAADRLCAGKRKLLRAGGKEFK